MTLRDLIEWCQVRGGTITLPAGAYGIDDPLPEGWSMRLTLPPAESPDAR